MKPAAGNENGLDAGAINQTREKKMSKVQVTHDFTHLFNDMPFEERSRLMPFMLEAQILHIIQTRSKAIEAHNRHMAEIEAWLKNLESSLNVYRRLSNSEKQQKVTN